MDALGFTMTSKRYFDDATEELLKAFLEEEALVSEFEVWCQERWGLQDEN